MAWLDFSHSTRSAAKSTALLHASHNHRERGLLTRDYTAALDSAGAPRVHSRIGIDGAQVGIGGNERYRPECRRHFLAALRAGRC